MSSRSSSPRAGRAVRDKLRPLIVPKRTPAPVNRS